MAKISELDPPPGPITGAEKIPVVQSGDTWGMELGEFLTDTVEAVTAEATRQANNAAASAAQAEANAILLQVSDITPLTAITGTGTAVSNTTACYFNSEYLADYDQWIYEFSAGMVAEGPVEIVIARVAGANLTDGQVVGRYIMAAGAAEISIPKGLLVPAGFIPGVRAPVSARLSFTSGAIAGSRRQRFTTSLPITPLAWTDSFNNAAQFGFALRSDVIHKSNSAYERVGPVEDQLGTTGTIGWSNIVATGSPAPAFTVAVADTRPFSRRLTQLQVGMASAGTLIVFAGTVSGGTWATIRILAIVAVQAGVNTVPLNALLNANEIAGVAGPGIRFQNSSNPTGQQVWITASDADPNVGQAATLSVQHRWEIEFSWASGLRADVAAAGGVAANDGMKLLAGVDNSGATDVTAQITAAQAAHPAPYVPPGDYLVTSIPRGGNNLWGPGRLIRQGRRFYLPDIPSPVTLHEKLRQRLATCIGTGAPLVVIGDSIAHWASASEPNNHWLDQLCALANINHSPLDVPIMTSFGTIAGYTPAFYGVTLTGTTSGGSRGPIGNTTAGSVVLASGAALSFTGTFAEIAFTFIREPGAGTLTVARDGATLATVDANGVLDLDRFSGLIATGVTASATYTITASGGSVEFTSLLRRGVRSATDIRRLNVMRAARGSFTFGDYTQAKVDSILKIASHLSTSPPTVMIALGINDAASISTASAMATAANAVIDRFIAGGVTDFIGILPLRPDQTVVGWQTRTANYDAVLAGLTQSYRSRNVQIIRPACDYVAGGLLTDGLHPGNAGNVQYLRQLLDQVA